MYNHNSELKTMNILATTYRNKEAWVVHSLSYLLLILVLIVSNDLTAAAPDIDIEFVEEQGVNSEWIHAQANCHTTGSQLYEVLDAIVGYPELHSWIRDSKIESDHVDGGQKILVTFTFPWPVGEQWSRIEVKKENKSTITWRQLEGSLIMNRGRVVIVEYEQQAYIDYRANIDVGYANIFTRNYKEEFVREFLMAIYNATRASGLPSTEIVASESQISIATTE